MASDTKWSLAKINKKMKLIYHVLIRLSLALLIVLTAWTVFFYYTMIEEINDEVDDALEDYSETIIIRSLAGRELPSTGDGTNNSFQINEISPEEAKMYPPIKYYDANIYIKEKKETEPARILRTVFTNNDGRYFLLEVSTPSFEKEDLREAITNWIIFLYIVLLITLLLVCIWIFYRSLTPLYSLLNWLDHYQPGKQHTLIENKTNIREFRKLNDAARQAVERSEQLFNQQKQFIGNTSHELQTPLAVCNNRIEWLLDNTELTEEQMKELFKTKHTLNYIVRLNRSLLFLSKIDNGQFSEIQSININDIIIHLLEDYKEIFGHYELVVSLEIKGLLFINMNEALAEALVSNLLKNAFVHNIEKGFVQVIVNEHELIITNSGLSSSLDSEHIFKRFYHGNRKKESTGLGLAIVDAICRQYHLQIFYQYMEEKHCFRIQK